MQTRLQLCERCLKEVEGKLIKLRASSGLAEGEEQTIDESLQFVRKALDAVFETHNRVDQLRSKRMSASGRNSHGSARASS
jgi:hypothetical protein